MDQILRSREHLAVYDVAGPTHAFPIVLVHGAAWTRNMWVQQREALSDEFRVIAVDLPGHGALREQPFQLATACHIVMASLKQEAADRSLMVGISLGGYVAMACAHDHPQDIAGLVLSGCCLEYRGMLGLLSRLDSSLVTTLLSEQRLTRMQEKALRGRFPENIVESQLEAGFFWKAMPQVYRELAAHDFHALLRTFRGPVLLVNGENDRQNRKGEAGLLRAAQAGQIEIIAQAGHLCNLDQPEAFTHQVRSFAKRLKAAIKN
jgi:pimeloyl-ACP methyl ester carboxylesterase